MAIQLWLVRAERPLNQEKYEALAALLPEERRQRLVHLPPEKHREVLCAYALLRRALEAQYGWNNLPPMARMPGGKPWFPEAPEVHFSLSHTAGAAAAVIGDGPVGVDMEQIRPVSRRTMERLNAGDTPEDFFRTWVRREARAKLAAGGLLELTRREPPLGPGEYYREVDTFPGYAAGVAAGEPPVLVIHRLVLEELLGT